MAQQSAKGDAGPGRLLLGAELNQYNTRSISRGSLSVGANTAESRSPSQNTAIDSPSAQRTGPLTRGRLARSLHENIPADQQEFLLIGLTDSAPRGAKRGRPLEDVIKDKRQPEADKLMRELEDIENATANPESDQERSPKRSKTTHSALPSRPSPLQSGGSSNGNGNPTIRVTAQHDGNGHSSASRSKSRSSGQ